jgi:hypothetical protein
VRAQEGADSPNLAGGILRQVIQPGCVHPPELSSEAGGETNVSKEQALDDAHEAASGVLISFHEV